MKFNPVPVILAVFTFALCSLAQAPVPTRPETSKPAAAPAAAGLPAAKEILDRYVQALGGREAIEKITSRSAAGTVELVQMNLKGTFESLSAPEARSYSKMGLAGVGDFIESSDGKSAWSLNPIQGLREKSGAELAQARTTNVFYRDTRLDKLFPKMEVKRTEKVGDRETYVVEGSAEGGRTETWYFDTKSGLMLRSDATSVSPEGTQSIYVYFEEYRPVDGVMIPFRLRTQTPQMQILITFTEVKHNVPVDETKFGKPKP